jgi:hypothetical protein
VRSCDQPKWAYTRDYQNVNRERNFGISKIYKLNVPLCLSSRPYRFIGSVERDLGFRRGRVVSVALWLFYSPLNTRQMTPRTPVRTSWLRDSPVHTVACSSYKMEHYLCGSSALIISLTFHRSGLFNGYRSLCRGQ